MKRATFVVLAGAVAGCIVQTNDIPAEPGPPGEAGPPGPAGEAGPPGPVDTSQFIQNTMTPQNANFNIDGAGVVGTFVVGPVSAPVEQLEVQGNMKVSGAVYAGKAFGSTAPFVGPNSSQNVVYGQMWKNGTLDIGASSGLINMNSLSQSVSNVGLVTILFSGNVDAGYTNSSYKVLINAHGLGYNDYTLLAERDDLAYKIQINGAVISFQNNSNGKARYTIKVVPFIIHDLAHADL